MEALEPVVLKFTRGSSLQPWSKGRHQARISGLSYLSHPDLEGTARDVAAIEANIDGMNSVFPGDEPDGMLVCRNTWRIHDGGFCCCLSSAL